MQQIRLLITIAILAILTGCAQVATYNPSYTGETLSVQKQLPGKALIYLNKEDAEYSYKGNPTSLTGAATTLTVPLGEITYRIAKDVFGNLFEKGADHATNLNQVEDYEIVVEPKSVNYSYAYNQLKNVGFAITPQVNMTLNVKAVTASGETLMDKDYQSGVVDGKSYMISGSPGDKVGQATHEAVTQLMNAAAQDIYNLLLGKHEPDVVVVTDERDIPNQTAKESASDSL